MQIFRLEEGVHANARALCDRHVINQLGETAELLAIAHYRSGEPLPPFKRLKPRVLRHRNHPCAVWAATSGRTYRWTQRYATALCIEYTLRFRRTHAYEYDIINLLAFAPFKILLREEWPEPPQVMPEDLRMTDTVRAYRLYYHQKSLSMDMRWTRRARPVWYRKPAIVLPFTMRAAV